MALHFNVPIHSLCKSTLLAICLILIIVSLISGDLNTSDIPDATILKSTSYISCPKSASRLEYRPSTSLLGTT